MYIQINELEKDLLREIMNVGVSKAADAFVVLTRSPNAIILTVPEVKIITPQEFPNEIAEPEKIEMAIKTKLYGELSGISLLMFYQEQTDWIVKHCLTGMDQTGAGFEEMRLSLMLEISNILTGAIITQLSNILSLELLGLPPEAIVPEPGQSMESLLCDIPPCQPIVLSVRTDFMDRKKVVEFPLLLVLEIESLSRILNIIRQRGIYDYQLLKRQEPQA